MSARIAQIVSVVTTALILFILFGPIPSSGQQIVGPPPNDAEKTGQNTDFATANQVIQYAYMANDAYNEEDSVSINVPGWKRVGDWETIFKEAGPIHEEQISDARSVGFYAAIYQNSKTGEICIAYQGTKGLEDSKGLSADFQAERGSVPEQYRYAAELATIVKTLNPSAAISATGHSKGGGEATYAAQSTPGITITNVITFNSASPPILRPATRKGTTQINVVVPRDTVGDNFRDRGNLPGKRVYVDSTTAYQTDEFAKYQGPPEIRDKPIYEPLFGTHDRDGIIGGLCSITLSSSCLSLMPTPAGQQPVAATIGAAPPSSPIPAAPPSWKVPSTTFSPSGSLSAIPPSSHPAPGGISLSKAAAARMPLNIAWTEPLQRRRGCAVRAIRSTA